MRKARILQAVTSALTLGLILAPILAFTQSARAQEFPPSPATSQANEINSLFITIALIAVFVFIFVEGLLIYIVVRFRRNPKIPVGETHRGHTKAEIAWTIVPALILLFIGVASAQVLEYTDIIPGVDAATNCGPTPAASCTTVVVNLTAHQWGWTFQYPDGTTSSALNVMENKKVIIHETSIDVIHAPYIPNFYYQLDAIPGRVNTGWFQPDKVGNFPLRCATYCYSDPTQNTIGHHGMVTTISVCDPTNTSCLPYGVSHGPVATNVITTTDSQTFSPAAIIIKPGTTVTFTNPGTLVHTVTPGTPVTTGGSVCPSPAVTWPGYTHGACPAAPGDYLAHGASFTVTFSTVGNYTFFCQPHAPGMKGLIIVSNSSKAFG
ncbi:MAG: cytochrome c oxidase subunit II transmembrane domain-containing protein [Thermoplasmatota archaeon]